MCGVLPPEGLSFRPLDFLDLSSSNATTAPTITKTATPAAMPAFAPVLRPPDGAFPSKARDVVGVELGDIEVGDIEAEEKGVAEGIVDVGPTVAASSKILFPSSQQVFSPQHHFFPPQFHTPTLPHWSAYLSSHQRHPHVKHTAIYLWLVTNVPKTVWTVPQRVCTALSCPNWLALIFPIICRIVLTKTVVQAHIVCDTDVSSATMVRHAACRVCCFVVASLKGRVEKGSAVATVTVAGRAGNL